MERLTLTASLLICTNFIVRSISDPNPSISAETIQANKSGTARIRDTIRIFTHPDHQLLRRLAFLLPCLYHALIVLFLGGTAPQQSSSSLFCPYPQNLTPSLFRWNWFTSLCIISIVVGGTVRTRAYATLGKNFTFALRRPTELCSDGLYGYLQHPSYTGSLLVMVPAGVWIFRWDGAAGCWLPNSISERLRGYGAVAIGANYFVALVLLLIRMKDEEQMLKEEYGENWKKWRKGKKRLIPGVW